MAKRGVRQIIPETTNWRDEKKKMNDELISLQNKINQLNITNRALLEENQCLIINATPPPPPTPTEQELRDIINKLYSSNTALLKENKLLKNYIIEQSNIISNIDMYKSTKALIDEEAKAKIALEEKEKAVKDAAVKANEEADIRLKQLEASKNEEIHQLAERLETMKKTNRQLSMVNSELYNKINTVQRPVISVKVDEPLIKDLRRQVSEKDTLLNDLKLKNDELVEKYNRLETNLDLCGLLNV